MAVNSKQRKIIRFIYKGISENGVVPSSFEISKELDIPARTVRWYRDDLVKLGFLIRLPGNQGYRANYIEEVVLADEWRQLLRGMESPYAESVLTRLYKQHQEALTEAE